nr:cadherin repeat domain-containing protein [Gammaproteobacteria bacterium]
IKDLDLKIDLSLYLKNDAKNKENNLKAKTEKISDNVTESLDGNIVQVEQFKNFHPAKTNHPELVDRSTLHYITLENKYIYSFGNESETANNQAPTFTSSGQISAAENTVLADQITATDPEGDALTYAISGGADVAFFTINTNTGDLSFADDLQDKYFVDANASSATKIPGVNFESPMDSNNDGTYEVDIKVTDIRGATTTQTFSIAITDANDSPEFTTELNLIPSFAPDSTVSVSRLLEYMNVSDQDGGNLGIALLANSTTPLGGEWQYSLNSGSSWLIWNQVDSTPNVYDGKQAILLDENALIQFKTNDTFFIDAISIVAWDQTEGNNGDIVNALTLGYGGDSSLSFSSAALTAVYNASPLPPADNTGMSITGTGSAETLTGGNDNDTLDGADGIDNLISAGGDDILIYEASDLANGGLIDGGTGADTWQVDSAVTITITSSSTWDYVENIEYIDLFSGNYNSTLSISAEGLSNITDSDNDLYVKGDANDTVSTADSWTSSGTSVVDSITYNHYTANGYDIFIQNTITQTSFTG